MTNEENYRFVLCRSLFLPQKQFHSENLFVYADIKTLVVSLVESLIKPRVSILIHSPAHIIITTVHYKA